MDHLIPTTSKLEKVISVCKSMFLSPILHGGVTLYRVMQDRLVKRLKKKMSILITLGQPGGKAL